MGFPKLDKQKVIWEASIEGLEGMDHLIWNLSHHPSQLTPKSPTLSCQSSRNLFCSKIELVTPGLDAPQLTPPPPLNHAPNIVHSVSTTLIQLILPQNPNMFSSM